MAVDKAELLRLGKKLGKALRQLRNSAFKSDGGTGNKYLISGAAREVKEATSSVIAELKACRDHLPQAWLEAVRIVFDKLGQLAAHYNSRLALSRPKLFANFRSFRWPFTKAETAMMNDQMRSYPDLLVRLNDDLLAAASSKPISDEVAQARLADVENKLGRDRHGLVSPRADASASDSHVSRATTPPATTISTVASARRTLRSSGSLPSYTAATQASLPRLFRSWRIYDIEAPVEAHCLRLGKGTLTLEQMASSFILTFRKGKGEHTPLQWHIHGSVVQSVDWLRQNPAYYYDKINLVAYDERAGPPKKTRISIFHTNRDVIKAMLIDFGTAATYSSPLEAGSEADDKEDDRTSKP